MIPLGVRLIVPEGTAEGERTGAIAGQTAAEKNQRGVSDACTHHPLPPPRQFHEKVIDARYV